MNLRSAFAKATDSAVPPVLPPPETSVLSETLPHLFRVLRREPAIAITLAYLFIAMAGIFYNYTFYRKFGIPVLTLSQVSDFLVAGVQQPMAILLVLSTLPIIWLIDRFNHYRRRQRAVRRAELIAQSKPGWLLRVRLGVLAVPPRWFTMLAYMTGVVGYGWMFVQVYADTRADEVVQGDAPRVSVWLNGSADPLPTKTGDWTYLGATSSYVFLFDNDARRAQIVPTNAIARIQPAIMRATTKHGVIIAPIP